MLHWHRLGDETMNKPAISRVCAVVRFAAVSLALAAISCGGSTAVSPVRDERADATIPLVADASVPVRDAAVRDASVMQHMTIDAASREPTLDAQVDLCAGTICVAPAHCEITSGFARCACPAGMEFVDLGGGHSPCQAIPPGAGSDDGGDAADGG